MAPVSDMVPAERGTDLRRGQFVFRGRRAGEGHQHPTQDMRTQRPGEVAEQPHNTRRHAATLGGQLWVSAWQDLHHA